MKHLIYILILLAISFSTKAQRITNDNISRVEFYFQKNNMDSAKKYINLALAEKINQSNPKAWFYKAQTYKELYKLYQKELLVSEYRDTAIEAILTYYTLPTNEQFMPNIENLIKYLSATYYNDAAKAFSIPDVELAKTNFEYYKKLTSIYSVDKNAVKENIIQFKLILAQTIAPIDTTTILDSLQKTLVKDIYIEILSLDSNNASANYNLSLIYYNEGVDIANNLDYDSDFDELLKSQDKIEQLFSKALPFMLKSYQANYNQENTLIGLKNIYSGLNNKEKSAYYENELNNLNK